MTGQDIAVKTRRLILVAASKEDMQAERKGFHKSLPGLQVSVPVSWPPEDVDDNVLAYFERGLADSSQVGWWFWYVLAQEGQADHFVLVGTCGLKGRPDHAGAVEIGYSILPEFQGRGYATEAVEGLLGWVWGHESVQLILAETSQENEPSKRVLLKAGFAPIEPGTATGNVRYALARSR